MRVLRRSILIRAPQSTSTARREARCRVLVAAKPHCTALVWDKTLSCSGSVTFHGLPRNRCGSCTMSATTSIIYDPNVLAALD